MTNVTKFRKAALAPPNIPWKSNWDTDIQPYTDNNTGYHETAKELRIEAIKSAKRLLELAPFASLKDDQGNQYTLAQIDSLIAELENTPSDDRFLKEVSSADRKLLDGNVNQNPGRVLDHLRFQILVNTPEEAATLRNALLCNDPPTGITVTSYKDQFRRPCEEGGHAALKTHILVSNGQKSLLAEMQISIKALEEEEFPKLLRRMERESLAASVKCSRDKSLCKKFANHCVEIAENLQARRRFINLSILKDLGFFCMLDRDYDAEKIMAAAQEQFETISAPAQGLFSHMTSFPRVTEGMIPFKSGSHDNHLH